MVIMPYIDVKTNQTIKNNTELKAALGEAITAIPGKSEAWLMVSVEGNRDMWFKGSDSPLAMFEVSIFGSAESSAYEELTKRLCAISEKHLGVPANRTYVKYTPTNLWGYNNFNF